MRYLKTYPLTLLCVAAIWYLCFFKPPSTSLNQIANIDKAVHLLMYFGTCSVFWWEYSRSHAARNWRLLWLLAVAAPVLMSGLIEILQDRLTTTRSGDWMDFVANSVGVLLAAAAGRFMPLRGSRSRR